MPCRMAQFLAQFPNAESAISQSGDLATPMEINTVTFTDPNGNAASDKGKYLTSIRNSRTVLGR